MEPLQEYPITPQSFVRDSALLEAGLVKGLEEVCGGKSRREFHLRQPWRIHRPCWMKNFQ